MRYRFIEGRYESRIMNLSSRAAELKSAGVFQDHLEPLRPVLGFAGAGRIWKAMV
jgi:hypothetical protein